MTGFSLFGESKRIHKHVECKEDFYRELYELFEIARSWYLQAEKNHTKTEYFIELFERSHNYIDCDSARCKNSRQVAIGIIGTLFRDSKCVAIIKKKEDFSQQELIELFLQRMGTGLPILTHKKSSTLTLGCQLSDRQMDLLVELVQNHDIFDFADNSGVRSELCRLFKCDLDTSIHVKNVRNVAILFDAMAQYHLINNNWQYVMGEGRVLTSIKKDGTEKIITSSCLSSSLSRIRRSVSMTASQYAICKSIEQILREE